MLVRPSAILTPNKRYHSLKKFNAGLSDVPPIIMIVQYDSHASGFRLAIPWTKTDNNSSKLYMALWQYHFEIISNFFIPNPVTQIVSLVKMADILPCVLSPLSLKNLIGLKWIQSNLKTGLGEMQLLMHFSQSNPSDYNYLTNHILQVTIIYSICTVSHCTRVLQKVLSLIDVLGFITGIF